MRVAEQPRGECLLMKILGHSKLLSSLYRAAGDWSRTDGATLSAALAYYGAVSLFPICLLLISGIGLWSRISPGFAHRQNKLVLNVAGEVSPWLAQQLEVLLDGIKAAATVAGPLGLASLILTAITVFVQIDTSFDRIWNVPGSTNAGIWASMRAALRDRLGAFLLLVGLVALSAAILSANIVLTSIRAYILNWRQGSTLWPFLQAIISWGLNAILFTALYKALPKMPVRWRSAISGGLFAAVIWFIGQHVLEAFVISDKYTAYGILGSFLAVMLWMYYASAVVLFGAMVVRNLDD
jgi:membrane protein